jgi:LL-diaminopimelate aminotransferase
MALIGSKEDPGDEALIPDPGYPVYGVSTRLAGATPVSLPMPAEKDFRPDLSRASVSDRTKALWLNFPSNPTAAVAEPATFDEAVGFAREHDLVLLHDAAYEEITYDGYVAPSVLQAPGGKDVALEFGSASKSFNMTGWRIGWAAGSAQAIRALGVVKTNLDSGQFTAIQNAVIAALASPADVLDEIRATYQRRRDVVVATLNELGWSLKRPLGSCYVWAPVPEGETSTSFADRLLDVAGVFVAPGSGYGSRGEGYVRFSLTVADDRLDEAMERIGKALA